VLRVAYCSARRGHFFKGLAGYNWPCPAIFKKYFQYVLAVKILTVDFIVCTLAVKKKMRAGFEMTDQTILLSVSRQPQKLKRKSCCGIGSKMIHSRLLKLASSLSLSLIRARIEGLILCRDVLTVCVLQFPYKTEISQIIQLC
jgi:hypothetical protein